MSETDDYTICSCGLKSQENNLSEVDSWLSDCASPEGSPEGRLPETNSYDSGVTASPERKPQFAEGIDVLAHWSDGLFYLGSVVQVDEDNSQCLVKFEDTSHYWCSYQHLQRENLRALCVGVHSATMPGADIVCTVCESGRSEAPNEIVLCDNCNYGYHQKCHKPKIPNKVLRPEVPWLCRKCVFATTARPGGAARKGVGALALQAVKKILPYNLKSLTWDSAHLKNKEHLYCYCAGPGKWCNRMVQCRRCQQWFHEACLQCLDAPLLVGDRFYVFLCAMCNYSQEYLYRIQPTWLDIAHLVLFGLSYQRKRKFHDFDSDIMPSLNNNWNMLLLKPSMASTPEKARRIKLLQALNKNSRFQCGSEVRKNDMWFALKRDCPPPEPQFELPKTGKITNEVIKSIRSMHIDMKPPITKSNDVIRRIPDSSTSPRKTIARLKKDNLVNGDVKSEGNVNCNGNVKSNGNSNGNVKSNGKGKKRLLKQDDCTTSSNSSGTCIYTLKKQISDSDASSITTLDSIIPKPTNFEGKNNPFRLDGHKSGKGGKRKKMNDTSSSMSTPPVRCRPHRAAAAGPNCSSVSSRVTSEAGSETDSIIEKRIVSPVTATKIPVSDLKSSISSFFGAENRIASGEKFSVLARRINPEGKMQYLIEWDGIS